MTRNPLFKNRLLGVATLLLLIVFGGVVFHAPLTLWLGTLAPDATLYIKAWKEVLIGIAAVLIVAEITRRGRWKLFKQDLWYYLGAFLVLHLIAAGLFLTGVSSTIAGLLIDTRFIVFFTLVYVIITLRPSLRQIFVKVFFAGAGLVMLFAVMQLTVLPHDILKHIGYSTSTIAPFSTVDQNTEYIRINSTLRGPNPLGAYAIIVLSLVGAVLWPLRKSLSRRSKIGLGLLAAASVATLWASYSRSALAGAGLMAVALWVAQRGLRLSRTVIIIATTGVLLAGGALYVARDSDFVSHVLLHEDPSEGGEVNSNDGHASSLLEGLSLMARQPFGAGVGSTGSASLLTDRPVIIENYYLFVAHEVGWLGAALFIAIFVVIMVVMWSRRRDWLAAGVFASGIGLAVIGLLLPVWVDDTVALIWWGLAGIAFATVPKSK